MWEEVRNIHNTKENKGKQSFPRSDWPDEAVVVTVSGAFIFGVGLQAFRLTPPPYNLQPYAQRTTCNTSSSFL